MKISKSSDKPISSAKAKEPKKKPATNKVVVAPFTKTLAMIVAVVGMAIYIQTMSYDFVLDDWSLIKENRVTQKGFSAIGEIFKTSYRYGYNIQGDELYRPIPKAIFAAFWGMFPDNPFPGHLLNILLYGLSGYLLMLTLARLFTQHLFIPFAASLLFMVHPLHTEVVANIKSLDEILGFVFFLLSFGYVWNYRQSGKMLDIMFSAVLFFLSLLCKESSITFLPLYALIIFFFTDDDLITAIKHTLVLLIPTVLFLIIRQSIVGQSGAGPVSGADNMLMVTNNIGEQKATAIMLLGIYLKLLLVPYPLRFDGSFSEFPLVGFGSWQFLLSFAVLLTMGIYAVMKFKSKNIFAFCILLFFISISVASNVVMIIGTSYAERMLYVPVLAVAIAASWGMYLLFIKNKESHTSIANFGSLFTEARSPMLISLGISVLFAALTIMRNPVWADNMALYNSGVKDSPNSTRTQFYLGNAINKDDYMKTLGNDSAKIKAEYQRAISYLKKSVEIYPSFTDPWTQMGVAYWKLKDYNNAYANYQKSLEINPNIATTRNNMGTLYFETGKYQEALGQFEKAIQLDPTYVDAYNNAGSAYGTMQQFDAAIRNFRKATELDPSNISAWTFLGKTYEFKGDAANARMCLQKAEQLKATSK